MGGKYSSLPSLLMSGETNASTSATSIPEEMEGMVKRLQEENADLRKKVESLKSKLSSSTSTKRRRGKESATVDEAVVVVGVVPQGL